VEVEAREAHEDLQEHGDREAHEEDLEAHEAREEVQEAHDGHEEAQEVHEGREVHEGQEAHRARQEEREAREDGDARVVVVDDEMDLVGHDDAVVDEEQKDRVAAVSGGSEVAVALEVLGVDLVAPGVQEEDGGGGDSWFRMERKGE